MKRKSNRKNEYHVPGASKTYLTWPLKIYELDSIIPFYR